MFGLPNGCVPLESSYFGSFSPTDIIDDLRGSYRVRGSSANWSDNVMNSVDDNEDAIELSDDGIGDFETGSSSSDTSFSLSSD